MNTETASTRQSRRLAPKAAGADPKFCRNRPGVLAGLSFAALLLVSFQAQAQTAPGLGTLSSYSVTSSTLTNGGGFTDAGDVCTTTMNGIAPAGLIIPCSPAVRSDQDAAELVLTTQAVPGTCTLLPAGTPLNQISITPGLPGVYPVGCYYRAGALGITAGTTVTITGSGAHIFVSTGGAIDTGDGSAIVLANGACADSVYWTAAGATTTGAPSTFVGTLIDRAGATLGAGTDVVGRILADRGTVTTGANVDIADPSGVCAAATPVIPIVTGTGTGTVPVVTLVPVGAVPVPTLPAWALIMLAALLAGAGFAATRRRTS